MKKLPALTLLIVLTLVLGIAAPLVLHAQARGPGTAPVANQGDEMANRTIRAFAPFLRAIISRRYNQAQQVFKIRRSVEIALEQDEPTRILSRFVKPDRFELNLIGGRTLGHNIGILLFTIASEDGPVAIKVYYYGFGNDIFVSRIDVADEWDVIEQFSSTVEILQAPVSVPLTASPE